MGRKAINKVDNSISDFLVSLHKAISNVGSDKLIETFNSLKPIAPSKKDEFLAKKIIQTICVSFNVNETIFDDDTRSDGVYQDFMCITSYLLKKYASYNQNEIAEMIKRHKSRVSQYVTRISLLKPDDSKDDLNLYKKLVSIEKKVLEIKDIATSVTKK